jgi:hypothetical protein
MVLFWYGYTLHTYSLPSYVFVICILFFGNYTVDVDVDVDVDVSSQY